MSKRTGLRYASVLLLAALVITACGTKKPDATIPAGTDNKLPTPEQKSVKMRFDFLLNAYALPYVVAKEKGIFAKYGLEVELAEGKGSAATAQSVGQGHDDFGLADAGAAATAISKDVPVKIVAGVLQKNNQGIIYLGDKLTLAKPADLVGKKGGYFQGSGSFQLLKAIEGVNKFADGQIKIQLMDSNARVPFLLENKIDFTGGTIDGDYLRALSQNKQAKFMPVYDLGVKIHGMSIVASQETISKRPNTIRAFNLASEEAWKYTLDHPEEAADIGVKSFPSADKQRLLDGIKLDKDYIDSPGSKGRVFGFIVDTEFQATVDVMAKYAGLESPKPAKEYFTNDFLAKK